MAGREREYYGARRRLRPMCDECRLYGPRSIFRRVRFVDAAQLLLGSGHGDRYGKSVGTARCGVVLCCRYRQRRHQCGCRTAGANKKPDQFDAILRRRSGDRLYAGRRRMPVGRRLSK